MALMVDLFLVFFIIIILIIIFVVVFSLFRFLNIFFYSIFILYYLQSLECLLLVHRIRWKKIKIMICIASHHQSCFAILSFRFHFTTINANCDHKHDHHDDAHQNQLFTNQMKLIRIRIRRSLNRIPILLL